MRPEGLTNRTRKVSAFRTVISVCIYTQALYYYIIQGEEAEKQTVVSIASKEMQVPRKKLVKRPNREKRAKKLKKGVAKRAGVWYYT